MGKKITVVDDDYAILDSLKYLLEDEGYEVSIFDNGRFINTLSRGKMPDLILLDFWMPRQNGGELTKKLKREKATKEIPIIIISASYNIRDLVLNAGADDFIAKPYDIEDLLSTMRKHLN